MSFIDILVRLVFLVVFVILEVIAVSTVFQLIFCIPGIKLLNQKGEKGIKFLVPVYGGYLFYKKTADCGIMYWFFAIVLIFGSLSYQLSPIFTLVFLILTVFFNFVFSINLASAYERSFSMGLGLFLLPIVFYFVLAFSKAPAESGDSAEALATA